MTNDESPLPLHLEVEQLRDLLAEGAPVVVLDCREADEYELVRLPSAQLVPMSQIASRLEELAPLRQKHVVVHCHHGGRSLRVTQWLRQQGFTRVQNLAGGIDAWAERIDPSLPRY